MLFPSEGIRQVDNLAENPVAKLESVITALGETPHPNENEKKWEDFTQNQWKEESSINAKYFTKLN